MIRDLNAMQMQRDAEKIRQRMEYGFIPYGIAVHPSTGDRLRELFAREDTLVGMPTNMLAGLHMLYDAKVPADEFLIMSEDEVRRRYAG